MDLRRLRAGEWIAALGGAALVVSLFLDWYADLTGWEALAVNDVVLGVIGSAAICLLLVTAAQRVPAVPVAFDALTVLAGIVATVLVTVRVLWPPGAAEDREPALWLALAGALSIVVGAWLAMRDDRRSRPGKPTDATGRPVPALREVEPIPPPQPREPAR
jgi:uncharacterized membrane protein HdeD (DUF308 family)